MNKHKCLLAVVFICFFSCAGTFGAFSSSSSSYHQASTARTAKRYDARSVPQWWTQHGLNLCNDANEMLSLPCAMRLMEEHHDSPESISFVRENQAILQFFKPMGKVDLGSVVYPAPPDHGGRNSDWVILNGKPPLIYPAGPYLSKLALQPPYPKIFQHYPHILGKGFSAGTFERMKRLANGGQSFIFQCYVLEAECCPIPYEVRIAYDFSRNGVFMGSRLLGPCFNPKLGNRVPGLRIPICPAAYPAPYK